MVTDYIGRSTFCDFVVFEKRGYLSTNGGPLSVSLYNFSNTQNYCYRKLNTRTCSEEKRLIKSEIISKSWQEKEQIRDQR